MILDYIGQELIWNLRGVNPYKPNERSYSVMVKAKDHKQNKEIVNFIYTHIKEENIIEVRYADKKDSEGRLLVSDIFVKNVLSEMTPSHLRILNYDDLYEEYQI